MGRIKCLYCKKYISDNIEVCKYCGFPVKMISSIIIKKTDAVLEEADQAIENDDAKALRLAIGKLETLKYGEIDIYNAYLGYYENNIGYAFELVNTYLQSKPNDKRAIRLKAYCLAKQGKTIELFCFVPNHFDCISDCWEYVYLLLIGMNESERDLVELSDEVKRIKDRPNPYWPYGDSTSTKYRAKVLKILANSLAKGMYFKLQFTKMTNLTTEEQTFMPELTKQELLKIRNYLCIHYLIPAISNQIGKLEELLDVDTPEKAGAESYIKALKKIKLLCLKLNPEWKETDNLLIYFDKAYFLFDDEQYIKEVDHVYDVLKEKYQSGEKEIAVIFQHLFVSCKLCNLDPKQKYADLNKAHPEIFYNGEHDYQNRKIEESLSLRGLAAFEIAEWFYTNSKSIHSDWLDAGLLSLSYYRIIELELNARLIVPLLERIDLEKAQKLLEDLKNIKSSTDKPSNKWKKYVDNWTNSIIKMNDISNPNKSADGLELGSLGVFIGLIEKPKDYPLPKYFQSQMLELLTDEGKEAFFKGDIKRIISQERIERYRNPPAHTRYLPYEIAKECRDFVKDNLWQMQKWFKK